MHRYQPDLLARIRTDYVHEQQERYRPRSAMPTMPFAGAERGERVRLDKRVKKLNDQLKEEHWLRGETAPLGRPDD